MSVHKRIGLAALVIVFLAAAALFGQAQGPATPPTQQQSPTIISGADLGFRVEGRNENRPVGTLMVRINGQWVEAELTARGGIKRLSAR